MDTEKATSALDLPHAYVPLLAAGKCACGREKAHALHDGKPLTEQAAASPEMLEVEKGT